MLDDSVDRLVIHSRFYNSRKWIINHTIQEDHLLFFAADDNFHTIVPGSVQKVSTGLIEASFPVPVSGHASVFRMTPLLNSSAIYVSNKRNVILTHKYRTPNFLVQIWDSEGYLVIPKSICKKKFSIEIDFDQIPFTGWVEFATTAGSLFPVDNSSFWEYRFWINEPQGNIFVQINDDSDEVIIPGDEHRYDPNPEMVYDNVIKLNWNDVNVSGTILPIIHGYRI